MSDLYNVHAAGARETIGFAIKGKTTNRSTSAGGAACTVALAGDADRGHVIGEVIWSYSAAPTGGKLTIASASDTLFEVDITAAGPDVVTFTPPLLTGKSEAATVTLAAPGGAVVGKLNVVCWRQ
jgi:hypothetical protein